MSDPNLKLEQLLSKKTLSPSERKQLENFAEAADPQLHQKILQHLFELDMIQPFPISETVSHRIFSGIVEKMQEKRKTRRKKILRITASASAAAVLLLTTGLWLTETRKAAVHYSGQPQSSKKYTQDVAPGGNKALLTLADGSTIVLDSSGNGLISQQGAVKVIKLDGTLRYQGNQVVKSPQYNTVSTPRGGQYQIILPDQSHVWLNAASSIRFPTTFIGPERRVEITGEAYFEVTKHEKPFIVKIDQSAVRVLGTHFNVMAYSDEQAINTTLLEGSVQFIDHGNTTLLKPGQQSCLKSGGVQVVPHADIENVMAWKNGYFNFSDVEFAAMARQLSRWYDVDVFCPKKINEIFTAQIRRDTKLSEVLKALELTGRISFDIQGKRVIATPKDTN